MTVEQPDRHEPAGAQSRERCRRDVRFGGFGVRRDELAEHVHVAVHDEELRVGALQDEDPHVWVLLEGCEHVEQAEEQRAVHEVRRRMVDRGDGDAGLDLVVDRRHSPL